MLTGVNVLAVLLDDLLGDGNLGNKYTVLGCFQTVIKADLHSSRRLKRPLSGGCVHAQF